MYTSALFASEKPDNVIVLGTPGVHEVRPGLQLVAAPWFSKAPTTDLVAEVLEALAAHLAPVQAVEQEATHGG